jgi:Uma2 family endonuclease
MATVTAVEIDDLEAPIVDPTEHYEVVDGQIVEEPPLGAQAVGIAALLDQTMGYHARANRLGRAVPEMLFAISEEPKLRRRPDVAFVSDERWPLNRRIPREAAWLVIPDLAVEIVSPTDWISDLMDKIEEYFAAGCRAVWVVYPDHNKVYAYDSPVSVRILQVGDELEGGAILPGYRLSLTELFEIEQDGPTPTA